MFVSHAVPHHHADACRRLQSRCVQLGGANLLKVLVCTVQLRVGLRRAQGKGEGDRSEGPGSSSAAAAPPSTPCATFICSFIT